MSFPEDLLKDPRASNESQATVGSRGSVGSAGWRVGWFNENEHSADVESSSPVRASSASMS